MNTPENTTIETPDWKLRQEERNAKGHLEWSEAELMKAGARIMSLLKEIHDRKSYRFKYSSFEEYCQRRWHISSVRARQIIRGESFRELLANSADLPETEECKQIVSELKEGQLRVLSQAEPVQAVQILKKLASTGEKITASKIAKELGMTKPQNRTCKCPHCGGKGRVPLGEDEEVAPVIHNETEM